MRCFIWSASEHNSNIHYKCWSETFRRLYSFYLSLICSSFPLVSTHIPNFPKNLCSFATVLFILDRQSRNQLISGFMGTLEVQYKRDIDTTSNFYNWLVLLNASLNSYECTIFFINEYFFLYSCVKCGNHHIINKLWPHISKSLLQKKLLPVCCLIYANGSRLYWRFSSGPLALGKNILCQWILFVPIAMSNHFRFYNYQKEKSGWKVNKVIDVIILLHWRKSGLLVHKETYKESRNKRINTIKALKGNHIQEKINNSKQSQTTLFKCLEELLHKSKVTALPTNLPTEEQPNKFSNYFLDKIEKIQGIFTLPEDQCQYTHHLNH